MNVEFVKFYEISRDDDQQFLTGTIHARLPDIGLNIRGVLVVKKKDRWFITFPQKRAFDLTLGKEVIYTTILFDDREKNEELIGLLRFEGKKFVEQYLLENPQKPGEKKSKPLEVQKISKAPNTQGNDKKPSNGLSVQKKPIKEWITPPPLKFVNKGHKNGR